MEALARAETDGACCGGMHERARLSYIRCEFIPSFFFFFREREGGRERGRDRERQERDGGGRRES